MIVADFKKISEKIKYCIGELDYAFTTIQDAVKYHFLNIRWMNLRTTVPMVIQSSGSKRTSRA